MPIATLGNDYLDQQCALCEDVHRVAYNQLEVGGVGADDPNVLALPPCPKCQAREFLIRSLADADGPHADAREPLSHQFLVNQLCERMAEPMVRRSSPDA